MNTQEPHPLNFSRKSLAIDPAQESDRIIRFIQHSVRKTMRRNGGVVGISGGIDSAVVLALTVRAFGLRHVIAVMMPDRDSDPVSETYARELAGSLSVAPILEDITAALVGFNCYHRRDAAIARVFPEYQPAQGYRAKIVLPSDLIESGTLNVFSVTVLCPDGRTQTRPLPPRELLEIVAATNLKQRSRMTTLYFHAEAHQFAVMGTANKNEHDLGFFVKYGDGGVDLQPIAHLYKSQIYQLAQHLGIPESIQQRTPTTDTYSAPCDQQEFFFRLPFETLDLVWHGLEMGLRPAQVAEVVGMTELQVQRVYDDIQRKRRTTQYLRMPPSLVEATAV